MRIPVHSPWLPGYIDMTQTILAINNSWTFPGQTSVYMQHHFQFLHGMPLYIYATVYVIYPLFLGNVFVWTLSVARDTKLKLTQAKRGIFLPLIKVLCRLSFLEKIAASSSRVTSIQLQVPQIGESHDFPVMRSTVLLLEFILTGPTWIQPVKG